MPIDAPLPSASPAVTTGRRHSGRNSDRSAESPSGRHARRTRRNASVWLLAVGFALIPVVFTAISSAAAQVLALGDAAAALLIALGAACAAVIGIAVMRGTRRARAAAPAHRLGLHWLAPLAITVVIALATQGVHASGGLIAAYALLTVAVAVNEEVWFRGVVLDALLRIGTRTAIIGSAALFAILHLANLASGQDLGTSALQVAFAAIFGFVAAELVVVTGSLWPVIAWHAAWDFVNFLGGNAPTPLALAGIGVACAIMVIYAITLWRGPVRTTRAQTDTTTAH